MKVFIFMLVLLSVMSCTLPVKSFTSTNTVEVTDKDGNSYKCGNISNHNEYSNKNVLTCRVQVNMNVYECSFSVISDKVAISLEEHCKIII